MNRLYLYIIGIVLAILTGWFLCSSGLFCFDHKVLNQKTVNIVDPLNDTISPPTRTPTQTEVFIPNSRDNDVTVNGVSLFLINKLVIASYWRGALHTSSCYTELLSGNNINVDSYFDTTSIQVGVKNGQLIIIDNGQEKPFK